MSKTLKQLLDQVNGEIGFEIPSQYFGSVDPNIVQLTAIANRSASILLDMGLQYLTRMASIDLSTGTQTSDSRVSSYPLPSDFHSLTSDTAYQFGRIDPALLPTSPDTWNYLISRSGPQSLRIQCRFEDGMLYVFSPDASTTLNFEYQSNGSVLPATQNTVSGGLNPPPSAIVQSFSADTDTWLLDDALIEMDIKWRYKKEKGLDWQGDYQDYITYTNQLRARDKGSRTIGWPKNWPYPNEPFSPLWVN